MTTKHTWDKFNRSKPWNHDIKDKETTTKMMLKTMLLYWTTLKHMICQNMQEVSNAMKILTTHIPEEQVDRALRIEWKVKTLKVCQTYMQNQVYRPYLKHQERVVQVTCVIITMWIIRTKRLTWWQSTEMKTATTMKRDPIQLRRRDLKLKEAFKTLIGTINLKQTTVID